MISDVLAEAVWEIERYQKEMPENYDSIKDKIDNVKRVMDELRQELDAPPKPGMTKSRSGWFQGSYNQKPAR